LDFIPVWTRQYYPIINGDAYRKELLKKVNLICGQFEELSELISLGGIRLFKTDSKTFERNLKRMSILLFRVGCYQTVEMTKSFKSVVVHSNLANLNVITKRVVQDAIFTRKLKNWAVRVPLRYGGKLIRYYSQGEDKRLKDVDFTENGWCLGMSVQWLGCKAQHLDFWTDHYSNERARAYRFVMASQNIRIKLGNTKDISERAEFRLKRFELNKMRRVDSVRNALHAEELALNIASSPFPFCRIGQYYKSGGGHAMAAYKKGTGIIFMDPNLGEFYFANKSRFITWFSEFTRFMNYDINDHYIEQYSYSQKPMHDALKLH
jgi:hypothetical protein